MLLGTAEQLGILRLGTILHAYMLACVCTCTHKHVHTLCSLGPCGTLQPGMLRTSYLGEFGGHQLGHQLVWGSAWFPSALLGSPRGWTHGPSAIRAQTSLAMENFGSGYRGSREGPSSVAVMETPPAVQENTFLYGTFSDVCRIWRL